MGEVNPFEVNAAINHTDPYAIDQWLRLGGPALMASYPTDKPKADPAA